MRARIWNLKQAVLIGVCLAANGESAIAGANRLPVTLFGQPCFLQGPLEQKSLKAIHAVSPEQIAPVFGIERTVPQTRTAIEHLEKAQGVPSALDRYRDKLGRQLKGQLAFLEGLEAAKKSNQAEKLISVAQPYLRTAKAKDFATLAMKLPRNTVAGAASLPQSQVIDQLFTLFNDSTDSDAEEEFHRSIARINVQYACNFDLEDSAGEETAPKKDLKKEPKKAR